MPDTLSPFERAADPLVVVPCLNEATHIGGILRQLSTAMKRLGGRVVVVDGGSTDGTVDIVGEFVSADPRISLLHNPDRIQSAAVNLAVAQDGGRATHLIRVDAHCTYPDDFCDVLMQQAKSVYADSIVVSMIAEGAQPVQRINAATQNASFGNGGAAHRHIPSGAYVAHGHHALMKIAAFRAVGGYDPSFTHNEDAELDYRLRKAGSRIWLTNATAITYHPRTSFRAVARQYFNYGAGRARNLIKHQVRPQLRQAKVIMVAPAVAMALLAPVHWVFVLPAAIWAFYCLFSGARMAMAQRDPLLVLSGIAAMIMHFAWSLGFWQQVLRRSPKLQRRAAP
ncbi:glycosyltransferase family 2 protein [Cognatiyoonia sp. IB215182]|uniref:glycosyltransferase family 2 protein n=1 Tax=Cognatiyoonia sp. IB215182 TaxID=3097353 RepID=UPI002A13C514|nr:glycosyltransferase family 2 protein [Cognatiyoonia sp. IB215182]MDX8355010.1 glycosyltransferase family 2 protein [Cognatiyoonia sp. IB215182]